MLFIRDSGLKSKLARTHEFSMKLWKWS